MESGRSFFSRKGDLMKRVGIICEYNPLHSGHAYQMEQIRRQDPDAAIVCLMSGHATQRGELAIADRYTRAEMAVCCGANVVLELPYPYSAASAAYFAGAGVAVLDALGVEQLSFGCECEDVSLLERAADLTQNEAFLSCVKERQRKGEGSAQAYFAELCERLGGDGYRFLANDILALEYIRAIRVIDSQMRPAPILRKGSAYRAQETEVGKHPSATALRALLSQGKINDSLIFVPGKAKCTLKKSIEDGMSPIDLRKIEASVLTFFRLQDPASLERIAEMQGGLSYRLHDAAMRACSCAEMIAMASAKSYPTARLRRAILYALTGVSAQDLMTPPAYLNLLATDQIGRGLIREWKKCSPIPVVAKPADAAAISEAAKRQFALAMSLDALFTMAMPQVYRADTFLRMSPRVF